MTYKIFLQKRTRIKADLIAGKLGRLQAIKAIYDIMPDSIKGLKEAKDMVDVWMPPALEVVKGQRQDSLSSQMITVVKLAEKEGCYDAADWIKHRFPGLGWR